MLVAQAVEAERLWQGCDIPDDLILNIIQEVHL
jgi:shikimate 5-dehydrogenase